MSVRIRQTVVAATVIAAPATAPAGHAAHVSVLPLDGDDGGGEEGSGDEEEEAVE